jgi:hypothetical protein
MEDTTETRVPAVWSATPAVLSATLAGLQAGMVGALWMLAWLGISAAWQNRGFWNPENLFATMFYGSDAVRSDFGSKTLPGLALYLLLYSLLGGIFAVALRGRAASGRLMLFGIIFSLGWFYLSFHLIWKSAMPLVYLLSPERPTVVGHLIFGACIGRFPAHYPGRRRAPPSVGDALESAPEPAGQLENPDSAQPAPLSEPPIGPGA